MLPNQCERQLRSLGAKFHVDLQIKVYPFEVSKLKLKPILSLHQNTRFHLQVTCHFLEKSKCKDSAWAINCDQTIPPYANCMVTIQTSLHLLRYASWVYVGPTELQVPVYMIHLYCHTNKRKTKAYQLPQKSLKRYKTLQIAWGFPTARESLLKIHWVTAAGWPATPLQKAPSSGNP